MKKMFKKLLVKFASVETDKGTIYIVDEIAVGVEVFADNEEITPAEDGEYVLEDERTIVVKDGKIEEIKEKEVVEEPETEEVEAEEEVVVEEPVSEPEKDINTEKIAELEAEIAALKAEIETIKESIAKIIETPAEEPVVEQFEKVRKLEESGLQKKALKLFNSAKK